MAGENSSALGSDSLTWGGAGSGGGGGVAIVKTYYPEWNEGFCLPQALLEKCMALKRY